VHIPYRGAAPAVTALLAGDVGCCCSISAASLKDIYRDIKRLLHHGAACPIGAQ